MTKFNAHEISKQFIFMTAERFLSSDRIIQAAVRAGANSIEDKIKILTMMRDSVRQVSLHHIFRSVQHRDEVFNAILEALSDLEDQLEEELIRQEEMEELQIKPEEKK